MRQKFKPAPFQPGNVLIATVGGAVSIHRVTAADMAIGRIEMTVGDSTVAATFSPTTAATTAPSE